MTHPGFAIRPRSLGVACAVGAVLLGLVYLAVGGAPLRYLMINIGALGIGLALLGLIAHIGMVRSRGATGATVAMAAALIATAMLGLRVEGAARWVALGGLTIQPSLILLPLMATLFARDRSVPATAALIAATAAVALQPDRAMSGMLLLALAAAALMQRDHAVIVALMAALAGFAATLVQADRLPAVPYVDRVFDTAFDVHVGAGLAVAGGALLLLVPAIVGWRCDPGRRATYAVFGTVWFAAIVAAMFGNYPTPVVGYGGSAIVGYALSLLALPRSAAAASRVSGRIDIQREQEPRDRQRLAAVG